MVGETVRTPFVQPETLGDELSRMLAGKAAVEVGGPSYADAGAWFPQVSVALARIDRAYAAEFAELAAVIRPRVPIDSDDSVWKQVLLVIYRAIMHVDESSERDARRLDDLTGLATRRVFHADLARLVERAQCSRQPLALVLLDLDCFNQVNYDAGPYVGDEILRDVAAGVAGAAGGRGRAYRCGGEELAVLLPGASAAEAVALAEEARATITRVVNPALGRRVTASIGVATVPDQATDAPTLFEKATRAVDGARRGGRNQVRLATFGAYQGTEG